jgi:rhodanese-related sulfurtransferase
MYAHAVVNVPELTPAQLRDELASEDPPKILDIRETHELEISSMAHDAHIPMQELSRRIYELDPMEKWVVVCRSGSRSAHVTAYLLEKGFHHVRNLTGGINRWVDEVDPTIRKY